MRTLSSLGCGLFLALAPAQADSPPASSTAAALPGVKAAEAVSATTGIAISPLLGSATVGAWQYWHTPAAARDRVPWNGSPWFWVPAMVIALLLAAKEPVLYFVPGAKKPLDLLEVIENKASALIAAPVVIQLALAAFRQTSADEHATALVTAGFDAPWLAGGLAVLGLLAVFGCVWLVAHTVNILILLSPSATLDILMRGCRSMVLVALTISSLLSPWLGLLVATVVIVVAIRCFGWAWRLTLLGSTAACDWLGRRTETAPRRDGLVRAFLGRARGGLPTRTRGTFGPGATGELEFRGRPLPWLPVVVVPVPAAEARIVRSIPGPAVLVTGESGRAQRWLGLPPRYQGAEEALGRAFGLEADTEHPLNRNLRAALDWLRDTLAPSRLAATDNFPEE